MYKIKRELEIMPTVYEIANFFCSMKSDEMAEFFNIIAILTKSWHQPFCMQMQYVTDNRKLTREARRIMETIGEYSAKETEVI